MGKSVERTGCSPKAWGLLGLALVVLCCPLWLFVRAVDRSAARRHRDFDMKVIGGALHNFHDVYKRFPPAVVTDKAGRPLSSWRFQLVPYMEGIMLDLDYGSRWDESPNRCVLMCGRHLFCWGEKGGRSDSVHTNVVAITGKGTAFDAGRVTRLSDTDSDTILAVEVAATDTYWPEPGDMAIEEVNASVLQGIDGTGTHVVFADGSVWFLSAETPLAEFKKFFTIDGAKQYDRDEVLGAFHEN